MLVRTDDDVYRVDAVWLGPPRATFPWRARYVSYGVGLLAMLALMFIQRRLGIGLDFFSVAWALIGTIAITRFLGKRVGYERPFGQVVAQFWAEVTGPRIRTRSAGGAVRAAHVRVRKTGGRAVGPSPTSVRTGTPAGGDDARPSPTAGSEAAPVRVRSGSPAAGDPKAGAAARPRDRAHGRGGGTGPADGQVRWPRVRAR